MDRMEEMSMCTTASPASVGFPDELLTEEVDDIDAPTEPASVTCELFVHIGMGLHLPDIAASAATSRGLAGCVREELARRDAATHRLHAWSNHPDWHLAFKNVCGLDRKERQWKALPPLLDGRSGAVCAMIGNFIYVVGGCRHGRPTNAVERLSLDRGTWEALPPLLGRRRVDADASVAVLGGHLYVCGGTGFDGVSASSCVDRFDPEQWFWEVLDPMPAKRRGAAAVVLSERLYICGGVGPEGSGLEVLSFDPVKASWELLPPMLDEHYRAQAVVANGTIYVGQRFCPPPFSAGSSKYHQSEAMSALTQGERFQATTRTWSRCMGTLFSSPGSSVALVMSSCLYLCEASCNGRSMSERCLLVAGTERYDTATSTGGGGSRRRVLGRNHTA